MESIYDIQSVADMWGKPEMGRRFGFQPSKGRLYHYTSSVIAVQNILTKGEIWMTKSSAVNDYSEIAYGTNKFREIVRRESNADPNITNLARMFEDGIKNNAFGDMYILSLSENGTSRLLWDSYSKKKGYCIGFDGKIAYDFANESFEMINVLRGDKFVLESTHIRSVVVNDDPNRRCSKYANIVLYDETKQEQLFIDIIQFVRRQSKKDIRAAMQIALMLVFLSVPFIKDKSLRDEEEYRLVVRVPIPEGYSGGKKLYLSEIQKYREMENKLIPYIVLKINNIELIEDVAAGYCNADDFSKSMLTEFISTLKHKIDIRTVDFSLRW